MIKIVDGKAVVLGGYSPNDQQHVLRNCIFRHFLISFPLLLTFSAENRQKKIVSILNFAEGEPIQVVPGASSKKDEKPREFALKMWQDGFSIDDGPLRDYNDQENREFLTDVMKGRIPRELIREARGGEVMVNMEDHKDKPFEKPKVN